jgi:hypothetical protein
MRRQLACLLALSTLAWSSSAAWSDDEVKPEDVEDAVQNESGTDGEAVDDAKNAVKDQARAKDFAATYGVTEQQVLDMRQQSGMGWGEVRNLLQIAQHEVAVYANSDTPITMDQSLQTVLAMREEGMGLGEIAQQFDTKLGKIKHEAKTGKPETAGKPDKPESMTRPDKPDKPEKPEKMEKPEKPEHPDKGHPNS